MKKFIIMSVMLLSAMASAQAGNVQSMTATSFSVRYVENSYMVHTGPSGHVT